MYLLTHRVGASSSCNFSDMNDMNALPLDCLGLGVFNFDWDCDSCREGCPAELCAGLRHARLQLLSTCVFQCLLPKSLGC